MNNLSMNKIKTAFKNKGFKLKESDHWGHLISYDVYSGGKKIGGFTYSWNKNGIVSAFRGERIRTGTQWNASGDSVEYKPENIIKFILGENRMTKKKQNLNEGMIKISSLLPVNKIGSLSMRGNKKDNFTFKGLPGQFNENGEKVLDENGNVINEASFTKRHYISIANILQQSRNISDVVNNLADLFADDNPNFNKDKFIKAAGE